MMSLFLALRTPRPQKNNPANIRAIDAMVNVNSIRSAVIGPKDTELFVTDLNTAKTGDTELMVKCKRNQALLYVDLSKGDKYH